MALDAPRPGRFGFQGDAKGKPLTLALAGEGGLEPGRFELRLTRLAGSLGSDRIFLGEPLTLSKQPRRLLPFPASPSISDRSDHSGGVRGESLSLALNAANLPIASGGRLLGYPNAQGSLNIATTLGGTLRAPQGHLSVSARGLSLASSKRSQLPALGLGRRRLERAKHRIERAGDGLQRRHDQFRRLGAAIADAVTARTRFRPQDHLAYRARAARTLGRSAAVGRGSRQFAADLAVSGTVRRAAANGHLLSDARYENFATGAVLTNMQLGRRRSRPLYVDVLFGGTRKREPHGADVVLRGASGPPPTSRQGWPVPCRCPRRGGRDLDRNGVHRWRAERAKVSAALTIDRAEINLPASLPPNVVVVKVVETNSNTGKPPPPPAAANQHRRSRLPPTSRSTCRATSLSAGMGSTASGAAS